MTTEEKKSLAIDLLRQKAEEVGRVPYKDDFDEPTRSRIKAFLGPWPRALEAAGLKEPRMVPEKSKKRKKAATKSKKQAISAHQKLEWCKAKREDEKASLSDNTKLKGDYCNEQEIFKHLTCHRNGIYNDTADGICNRKHLNGTRRTQRTERRNLC